jgi:hypothetical protein
MSFSTGPLLRLHDIPIRVGYRGTDLVIKSWIGTSGFNSGIITGKPASGVLGINPPLPTGEKRGGGGRGKYA